MTTASHSTPWSRPEWSEAATTWIRHELDRHGIGIAGQIEHPHARPWSTVLRVPTTAGALYFKACGHDLGHEVALTTLLAARHPTMVPEVLAADPTRDWMLMRDGGATLREILRRDRDPGHWEALLPRYAELQIALAARVAACLALGVPDRRTTTLPAQFDDLMREPDLLAADGGGGPTVDERAAILAARSELERLCRRLADAPIPDSLHHGDLHDGNVLAGGESYRLFDWGDASVSHPFFSLRTVFVSLEISLGLDGDLPAAMRNRLRDAYLEPWSRYGPRDELVRVFECAALLSPLCSALGWQRSLRSLDGAARRDYLHVLPALTRELLDGIQRSRA